MPHRYRPYAVLAAVASAALFLGGCSASDQASPPPGTAGGAGSPAHAAPTSGSGGTATPTGSLTTPAPPSSPTSATATPKPTATAGGGAGAPGVPAAARQHTDKGAEAFARYYVDLINETGIKPVQGKLEPLAADSCKSCANFAGNAKYMVIHNEHNSGPTVQKGKALVSSSGKSTKVSLAVDQLSVNVFGADGHVERTTKKHDGFGMIFDLNWTVGGWRIQKIFIDTTGLPS